MGNTHVKPHPRTRNKKQVHWKAADRPSSPGKPHLCPDSDLAPDLVTIRWAKPARDGGSPITGYLVEHRRTGSPHWVRASPVLVSIPELTISGLEPGWRYQFRVFAENAVGLSDPSDMSEPLTVALQKFAVAAPRFVEDLTDVVALENDKVEFVVHFLGQPTPKICWFKDGFEIFSSRRTRILTDNDKSILTIHQSALPDDGEIKCTATNKAGHVSTKAKLTLEAPPSIRLPRQYEDGMLFEIGEMIRLKVSVAGRPTPLIFWMHNGESIQNNDRYEVEYSDKSSILKVGEARRSDRGEYQIKAVNKIGEDIVSFLVTVTDKPSPPGRARVVMTLGRSVTLSWGTPDDDGGCKIGNYIVEYYRLGWNVWLKAATSRQLTTILGDLIEGSEYKFRIKAESPYGVSEPSEESDVVFIPDAKRGITSPEIRSRSQPRDFIDDVAIPVAAKRKHKARSQSSTRAEIVQTQSNINETIFNAGIPRRPERNKIKSPPSTPEEVSPLANRKEAKIKQTIIDRASIARDLAYGSPDFKVKKTELTLPNKHYSTTSSERSPSPMSEESQTSTPSPVIPIRSKSPVHIEIIHKTLQPHGRSRSSSPSPNRNSPTNKPTTPVDIKRKLFKENSENISGSSEFMLVLYPDENAKGINYDTFTIFNRSSFLGQERRFSEELFDFDEYSIPPPLSLSAPELGAEPPNFDNLKTSASSTELLHERAMMRFNEAAQAEEAELERRTQQIQKAKGEPIDIPRIQINSKDDQEIVGLEKKSSFRRRLSAGGGMVQQQILWAQRRYSLRNTTDLSEIVENKLQKERNDLSKRTMTVIRQRSESEEKEEEVFEQVRNKMALTGQSSFEKRSIEVADENKWLDDYEESLSEEESSSSDDERFYDKLRESKVIYGDEEDDDEEEVYHPGMMTGKENVTDDAPFEILMKKNKLPDPNFVPKPILKKTDRPDEKVDIPKPSVSAAKTRSRSPMPQSRERSQSLIQPDIRTPTANSRNITPDTRKQRSFSLIPSKLKEFKREPSPEKPSKRDLSHSISAVAQISGMTAASIVLSDRLLNMKQAEEEARVVVDHYGDIVKNYGKRKSSTPQLYLDRDSLKKAADGKESPNEDSSKRVNDEKELAVTKAELEVGSQKLVVPQTVKESSPQPQRRLERSPSPRRRHSSRRSSASSQKSRTPSKSPVRQENWRGVKPNAEIYPKKLSPSPIQRVNSERKKSLSPIPPARPRPMLKEIMTQTSIGLEMNLTRTPSMVRRGELTARAEMKVRSAFDYITDLAMFFVACWLYFFSNELLAIPILLIMVYRQLKDEICSRIPKWILKRLRGKTKKN